MISSEAGRDRSEAVMKVTDTSQIKALAPGRLPEPSRPASDHGEVADRVSTDDSARVAAAVAAASQAAGTGHTARLAAIEAAVRQGTYKPDPGQIAQQILDDAELAARLQALFSK
jgi:negative regulator of flagellin synthesis FlgM